MSKLVLLSLLFAATAHAQGRLEVGAALGGHAFSRHGELGVDDRMVEPSPVSSVAVGARAAYLALPWLAVEGEALAIPTKDSMLGDRALGLGLRAHARFDLPVTGGLRPFFVVGLGMHALEASSSQLRSDADQEFHWGAGASWAMTDMLDLRVDARQLLVPDRTANGATSDFELTAGVTYHFGTQGPVHVSPPAVVAAAEPDRDMDTVPDRLDACPSEPEDVDGFDDDDGCPELDNDQDGVRDADDLCPSELETRNGYRDDDGCPDQPLAELGAIAFGRESTRLDVAADAAVARAQQVLAQYPALSVEVAGYTSPDERTRDLARSRAEAVKAALVKRGITAARVLTVGHAERKGRRSELKIVTPEQLAM